MFFDTINCGHKPTHQADYNLQYNSFHVIQLTFKYLLIM